MEDILLKRQKRKVLAKRSKRKGVLATGSLKFSSHNDVEKRRNGESESQVQMQIQNEEPSPLHLELSEPVQENDEGCLYDDPDLCKKDRKLDWRDTEHKSWWSKLKNFAKAKMPLICKLYTKHENTIEGLLTAYLHIGGLQAHKAMNHYCQRKVAELENDEHHGDEHHDGTGRWGKVMSWVKKKLYKYLGHNKNEEDPNPHHHHDHHAEERQYIFYPGKLNLVLFPPSMGSVNQILREEMEEEDANELEANPELVKEEMYDLLLETNAHEDDYYHDGQDEHHHGGLDGDHHDGHDGDHHDEHDGDHHNEHDGDHHNEHDGDHHGGNDGDHDDDDIITDDDEDDEETEMTVNDLSSRLWEEFHDPEQAVEHHIPKSRKTKKSCVGVECKSRRVRMVDDETWKNLNKLATILEGYDRSPFHGTLEDAGEEKPNSEQNGDNSTIKNLRKLAASEELDFPSFEREHKMRTLKKPNRFHNVSDHVTFLEGVHPPPKGEEREKSRPFDDVHPNPEDFIETTTVPKDSIETTIVPEDLIETTIVPEISRESVETTKCRKTNVNTTPTLVVSQTSPFPSSIPSTNFTSTTVQPTTNSTDDFSIHFELGKQPTENTSSATVEPEIIIDVRARNVAIYIVPSVIIFILIMCCLCGWVWLRNREGSQNGSMSRRKRKSRSIEEGLLEEEEELNRRSSMRRTRPQFHDEYVEDEEEYDVEEHPRPSRQVKRSRGSVSGRSRDGSRDHSGPGPRGYRQSRRTSRGDNISPDHQRRGSKRSERRTLYRERGTFTDNFN